MELVIPLSDINTVFNKNFLFQIVQCHGKQTRIYGSIGIIKNGLLLFGKTGCPGIFQCRNIGFSDLLKGGKKKLPADKCIIPVDQVTIGSHISIGGNQESGTAGSDFFRFFYIIQGSLKKTVGMIIDFLQIRYPVFVQRYK